LAAIFSGDMLEALLSSMIFAMSITVSASVITDFPLK
jgi:hypothetical protein